MKAYTIHVTGIVQGIGFRPFVSKLAHELRLVGTVRNDTSGVEIHITRCRCRLPTICRTIAI